MAGISSESKNIKSGFFLTAISLISLFLVPLLIAVSLLSALLTNPEFYASILRNGGLIETFVEAGNWQMEKRLRREIEMNVHLDEFRVKYGAIKALFDKKKESFDSLNRTQEFEKLKRKLDELSDLSYENAPDNFKSETGFNKYKANEIIASRKDSFSGEIYGDLKIVGPVLSKELNEKLINKGVKAVFEKYIQFFTSYYGQRDAGNVYYDGMGSYINGLSNPVKVKLPEIEINLYVDDDVNGILQKRHLTGEIFIDRIMNIPEIKKRDFFIRLFRFSESSLGEMTGESYIKDYNFTVSGGVIKSGPILLSGSAAAVAEYLMIAATWVKYLKFVMPGFAILILIFLFRNSAEKDQGYRHLRMILILPSLAVILFSAAAVAFSGNLLNLFPDFVPGPVLQAYLKSFLRDISLHLFAPLAAVFAVPGIAGLILRRGKSSH
ncbi:MAG: hypothetical protein MUC95_00785 [Spirochaetes bacterium]|nr:hypothetical protein [Spirochaetota bacterium]